MRWDEMRWDEMRWDEIDRSIDRYIPLFLGYIVVMFSVRVCLVLFFRSRSLYSFSRVHQEWGSHTCHHILGQLIGGKHPIILDGLKNHPFGSWSDFATIHRIARIFPSWVYKPYHLGQEPEKFLNIISHFSKGNWTLKYLAFTNFGSRWGDLQLSLSKLDCRQDEPLGGWGAPCFSSLRCKPWPSINGGCLIGMFDYKRPPEV